MTVRLAHGLWKPYVPPFTNAFESIATYTAGSTIGTLTFSSIPSTYKHLQLRCFSRETLTSSGVNLRFNGDTGTNYHRYLLDNYPGNATRGGQEFTVNAWNSAAWVYNVIYTGQSVIDIFDYADTTKTKMVYSILGSDNNGSTELVGHQSGVWNSTAAINSITLFNPNAIDTDSTFALYGIKAA